MSAADRRDQFEVLKGLKSLNATFLFNHLPADGFDVTGLPDALRKKRTPDRRAGADAG